MYRTGDPSDVTHADRSRLSALTKSIEEKQNALRPLLSRLEILMGRSEQQKRVNKAYLSSIRRLPREILSKIFLLVAAASSDHERRSTVRWIGGCMGGRYKFAEVCRMWRSVALGTAGLWTSVHLAIRESPAPFTWSFARFEAELKLTKMMPLDVRLSGMWHSTLQSHAGEAWRLLRQEAYRWRSLDLFDLADLAEILTESIDCPILEKLRAKVDVMSLVDNEAMAHGGAVVCRPFDSLRDARQLHTIHIHLFSLFPTIQLRLPRKWKLRQITLLFENPGISQRPGLLLPVVGQFAKTLRRLSIAVLRCDLSPLPPVAAGTIQLPVLMALICSEAGYFLLEHITAPKLQYLRIELNNAPVPGAPPYPLERISAFQALRDLHLTDVSWATPSLLSTLLMVPQLSSLVLTEIKKELAGRCITADLISGLTRGGVDVDGVLTPQNPSCPLPNLTALHLTLYKSETGEAAALVASLRKLGLSRKAPGGDDDTRLAPLSAFTVRYRGSDRKRALAKDIPSWGV